jgi:4-hydroxybenzoate polyprenyltransferase
MKVPENKTGPQGGDNLPVLYVCLNGTLVATDTLWESVFRLIRSKPLLLLALPLWLARGKAWFRHRMARAMVLDPSSLPYRNKVIEYLRSQKASGRQLVLATSAHQKIASAVAAYLGLFEAVLASDESRNLAGKYKLEAIRSHGGGDNFEFVCTGSSDGPVMKAAASISLVNPGRRILARTKEKSKIDRILVEPASRVKATIASLRLHHWTKNLLLAVPLILAQQWNNTEFIGLVAIAMLCVCLAASSIYICNDLFDLAADRAHPVKSKRPLASGALEISTAVRVATILLAAGVFLALVLLPKDFVLLLLAYVLTALAYSVHLKRRLVLDVIVLAGLYTLRIFAGGAAVGIPVSAWLLGFSMFFFLSLAFAKRSSEVAVSNVKAGKSSHERPYLGCDLDIFRSAGSACGLLSVLVLALYINSPAVRPLYRHPQVLWLLCPVLLYWILRVWFLTLRTETDDDPVILALRDRASYVVGALTLLILAVAS